MKHFVLVHYMGHIGTGAGGTCVGGLYGHIGTEASGTCVGGLYGAHCDRGR